MRRIGLADDRLEVPGIELIHHRDIAIVDHPEPAIVCLELAVVSHECQVQPGEMREDGDLLAKALELGVEPGKRGLGPGNRIRHHRQDLVSILDRERLVDTAGHAPSGMDALAAENLDDGLSDLAQANTVLGQVRMILGNADNIADRRISVHTEEEIGRRQVEEAECMRLRYLGKIHDPAQIHRCLRNAHGHQVVARLGRRHEMAHRANATNPSHEGRHFVERPALGELLEAAKLGDMEQGIRHFTRVVELNGDLGVTLDASYRVDDNLSAHPNLLQAPNRVSAFTSGWRPANRS